MGIVFSWDAEDSREVWKGRGAEGKERNGQRPRTEERERACVGVGSGTH